MQDIIANAFIVFLFIMYAGIALAFIIAGVRRFFGRPGKTSSRRPAKGYRGINSPRSEENAP